MPRIKSVSEKQLAANRANAAQSTGPRTAEGKARSSRNAVKHGFTGSHFSVMRVEDLDEVAKLKADAVACYRPVNAEEMFAVERIAIAQQMILRAARVEAGMFTYALDECMHMNGAPYSPLDKRMLADDLPITRAQNLNFAMAQGFRRLAVDHSTCWTLLFRYTAQAERLYRRAVEDFERLKALRTEMPNEPISDEIPEEKQELATLEDIFPHPPEGFVYNPQFPPSPADPRPQASDRHFSPPVK